MSRGSRKAAPSTRLHSASVRVTRLEGRVVSLRMESGSVARGWFKKAEKQDVGAAGASLGHIGQRVGQFGHGTQAAAGGKAVQIDEVGEMPAQVREQILERQPALAQA